MLLAPFSLTDSPVRKPSAQRVEARTIPHGLQAWAIGGIVLLLLVPSLRGDNLTGLSLPFWLVAAPLINIVWISRARWFTFMREHLVKRLMRGSVRSRRIR